MQLVPHRRQFVIGTRRYQFGEDWDCLPLPDGFVLSFQSDLRVSGTVQEGLVLGTVLPGASQDGRAGRFVTVAWPFLRTDASALLSVFYATGPDGAVVSSSAALLARIVSPPAPPVPPEDRRMWWGGVNWVPGPGAPVPQARKLLPGQRIRLTDLVVDEPRDVPPLVGPISSTEEAQAVLAAELTATVSAASAGAGTTYLALTAGLDSRTLLAAGLAAGIRFEVVTQVVRNPADVRTAADMARYLGVRHHVVEPLPHDDAHVRTWHEHTLHAYDDADNNLLLPRSQYRFFDRDTVLLRGGAFEFGRCYLADRLRGLHADNTSGALLWQRFEGNAPPHAQTVRHLDDWLAARRERHDGLPFAEGFYNDHRLGGWLASLEHGLELLPGVSVVPANSHRVKTALMAPPPEERVTGALQRAVIHDLAPQLDRFPINPGPTGLDKHVRATRVRAGRAARALRQLAAQRRAA